jgi:Nif-specific regulatory protein
MRVTDHWLEDGDQVSAGETVLVFRDVQVSNEPDSPRVTLLRACTLLFLFRGLATSSETPQQDHLEMHVLSLVGDLVPFERGAVILSNGEEDLLSIARERSYAAPTSSENGSDPLVRDLPRLMQRMLTEGPFADGDQRHLTVPIWAAGILRGGIALSVGEDQADRLEEHLETLSAISTLASTAIENVREVEALRTANQLLQERLTTDDFGIVGRSPAMRRLLQLVERVAAQNTTVLVLGESGTGKELIARALHQGSPRRRMPFVAINCAALTETLLESELFGHEKGAFTGAVAQKKGKLEIAEGGTVFLDEIGELAPSLQAKLLRVLQQREFERVGGTRTLHLDVRLIAATNRDLSAEVRKGVFREDLFHRLNVVALRMPPLRDRPEDVPMLADYFLRKSAKRIGRNVLGISPETESYLVKYAWPGNVRELENAIERAVVLTDSDQIQPEDLPEIIVESTPAEAEAKGSYMLNIGDARRDAILQAWQQGGGDYKEAAKLLGIHPNSLLRLIRKLKLREALKRAAVV